MGRESDVVISIKERAINRALAASFYTNQGSGLISLLSQALHIDGTDRGLRLIDPPMIILISDGTLLTTFGAEAWVKVLGIQLESDISANARIRLWASDSRAYLEIQDLGLDLISFNNRVKTPGFAVSAIEGLIRGMMSERAMGPLIRSVSLPPITIPPMVSGTDEQDLSIVSISINEGALIIGASREVDETVSATIDEHQHDLKMRLTESFLEYLIRDMWDKIPNTVEIGKKFDIPNHQTLMSALKGTMDTVLAKGLNAEQIKIDRSWVEADAVIQYGCPKLRLLDRNRVEIVGCPLRIGTRIRPRIEMLTPQGLIGKLKNLLPSKSREVQNDRKILDLADLSKKQDLRIIKATAKLSIDDGDLLIDMEDIDIDLALDWNLPGDLIERLSSWMVEQIVELFPPIRISLPLENIVIPVLGISPNIYLTDLESSGKHLDVCADLEFKEVPKPIAPMPRFLADRQLRLVHREGCPSAHTIPENVKMGYFSLYEAISDGCRGCPDCLHVYRNVSVSNDANISQIMRRVVGEN
ncbi:MAG: hypothetical protein GX369_01415 [Euryarchaeota archaeon]|nr:hypothetical protein [Euryarchaeota archaeon]